MSDVKVKQVPWDKQTVPMERWGKDHWTTLLYLESRAVDYRGRVDPSKMRTSRRNWRLAGMIAGNANIMATDKYPTRLIPLQTERAQFDQIDLLGGHDDWECMHDMADEGLLEFEVEDERKRNASYPLQVTIKLTPKGREVCSEARRRREETGRAQPV